ncbi:MAG TPA: hypothetical protein VFF69_08105 [Phycisphaerales bacterium]|nr:hypothetical protein [Phycisphaerales bacterium]
MFRCCRRRVDTRTARRAAAWAMLTSAVGAAILGLVSWVAGESGDEAIFQSAVLLSTVAAPTWIAFSAGSDRRCRRRAARTNPFAPGVEPRPGTPP